MKTAKRCALISLIASGPLLAMAATSCGGSGDASSGVAGTDAGGTIPPASDGGRPGSDAEASSGEASESGSALVDGGAPARLALFTADVIARTPHGTFVVAGHIPRAGLPIGDEDLALTEVGADGQPSWVNVLMHDTSPDAGTWFPTRPGWMSTDGAGNILMGCGSREPRPVREKYKTWRTATLISEAGHVRRWQPLTGR